MITLQDAKKFLKDLMHEVWINLNIDAVHQYYHSEFLGLLFDKEELRYSDVLKRVEYNKNQYSRDRKCIFHDVFITDDQRIVARYSFQVVNNGTAKLEEYKFLSVIQMKDNKMYRQWSFSSQVYFYKAWELPESLCCKCN